MLVTNAMAAAGQGRKASRRMCAGCGARDESVALVRLVVGPTAPFVAVDLGRRLGGRGISVHARRSCVARALRRGALARALNGTVTLEPESVQRMIVEQYQRRLQGLYQAAGRSRKLEAGTDAVRASLAQGRGALLLVAADARGRATEIRGLATAIGCATATWGTKASLGEALSRHELGVTLVTDRGIAQAMLACFAHIEALSEDE
ncbi:MAG: DUF448 domain-containing protein [Myxococcota bacterium]